MALGCCIAVISGVWACSVNLPLTRIAELTLNPIFLSQNLQAHGWVSTPPLVEPTVLDTLISVLAAYIAHDARRGGTRGILDIPAVQALARSVPIHAVAKAALGPGCFAVRGILFDKTPEANWKVIWHQDLTIAIRERRTAPGFGPWSEKGGIPHVQPPASILERMIAVRVHLDACTETNGPVRVLPGSHRCGRLSADEIDAWKLKTEPVDCLVERGGILAFYPLLLHASSPALSPIHRRVIHLEFAAAELRNLPEEIAWHQMVQ